MYNVAAAWFMTSLTSSPFMVALLQTATSLPVFLLGLPAGALADMLDRRLILLFSQFWLLLATTLLGVLTIVGVANTWLLLLFTFGLGLGVALVSPVWQAITPELVSSEELPSAIGINSFGFNMARAVGPAIGGLIVAASGSGAVFLLNAVLFLGSIVVIFRWKREVPQTEEPVEHFWGALRAGVRYIRFSPVLRSMLVRTFVFIVFASGLWTLLPVIARKALKLEASGLGLLQGCLGLGALLGALWLPRGKERYSIDHLISGATVVFALATLALAWLTNLIILVPVLVAGGAGWLIVTSSLNFAAVTYAPKWVQARALACYMLIFQGGLALGSVGLGLVAQLLGEGMALTLAAVGLVLGLLTLLRWRLQRGTTLDLRPSQHWSQPALAEEPELEEGPLLLSVEYRVKLEDAAEFSGAMYKLGRARRRTGAADWKLFRDPCEPERYVETFMVESWAEHLRQCQRVTMTDRTLEEKVNAFNCCEEPPPMTRLLGVHPRPARQTETKSK
jgi:MFS family permease